MQLISTSTEAIEQRLNRRMGEHGNFLPLACLDHNYALKSEGVPPTDGCERCWEIYYRKLFAITPQEQRHNLAERLMRVTADASGAVVNGKWDLELAPKVEIIEDED